MFRKLIISISIGLLFLSLFYLIHLAIGMPEVKMSEVEKKELTLVFDKAVERAVAIKTKEATFKFMDSVINKGVLIEHISLNKFKIRFNKMKPIKEIIIEIKYKE